MTGNHQIRPFRIDIPEVDLIDLRARLTAAWLRVGRLPDRPRSRRRSYVARRV